MSVVQFTENNNKDWVFYKGKYLNFDDYKDSDLLISNNHIKVLKDCIDNCAKDFDCNWFMWDGVEGECQLYKLKEKSKDNIFQWRYDSFKYENYELPLNVFHQDHYTETQENCIEDCYLDTNCVCTDYIKSKKSCRIFYNYSNENYYFGYYAETKNPNNQGGEPISLGQDIYNTEAIDFKSDSFFTVKNIIAAVLGVLLIFFGIYIIILIRRSKNESKTYTHSQSISQSM